jgi:hypothetical protein
MPVRFLAVTLVLLLALYSGIPAQPDRAVASATQSDKVAYIVAGDLWWRPVDGGPAHRLTRSGGYHTPRWSPEGRWILVQKGKEFRVVRTDGAEEHSIPVKGTVIWHPSEDDLAYLDEAGKIGRIAPHQPENRRVVVPAAQGERRSGLLWSVDGRRLAYAVERGAPPERGYAGIWAVHLERQETVELYATHQRPSPCFHPAAWAATGQLLTWVAPNCSASLLADGAALMAVSLEGGTPVPIAEDMLAYPEFLSLRGARLAAVTGGGRISWWNKQVRVFDLATGSERAISPVDQAALSPDWAPDGRSLAYSASPDAGPIDGGDAAHRALFHRRIWISAADGSWRRQLTHDPGYRDEAPTWLPGGSRLLFARVDEQGRAGLWTVNAKGGKSALLTELGARQESQTWFGYYGWYDFASLFDLLSRGRSPVAPAPRNPHAIRAVSDLVAVRWQGISPRLPMLTRMRTLAEQLRTHVHMVQLANTDDDGQPDLLAVPTPAPDQTYDKGPVILFRGADLTAGRVRPHLFPLAGDFRRVETVADVNGDARTETVVTYQGHGTRQIVTWLFLQWDGRRYRRVFDAMVDNWRGPNDLWIGPGTVTVTCRPLGVYDHKHSPHRQHTEVWTWDGTAYRLTAHHVPPPPSDRWAINDAEPYFLHREYAKSLPLYQLALTLPREEGDRDWKPYIHLRLGQGLALLGRNDEARRELQMAGEDPGQIGRAAATFLQVWQEKGLVAAFTALMSITPGEAEQNLPYSPVHGFRLAPPAVVGSPAPGTNGAVLPPYTQPCRAPIAWMEDE